MAVRQNTIVSRVATVSLRQRLTAAREAVGFSWTAVGLAATLIPVVGVGIAYLIDIKRNSKVQKNQMDVLADYYKFQVGAVLGMNPEKVRAKDLELAAQINPALSKAIQSVTREKASADRSSTMSNAAIWAVSGANLIPGAGLAGKLVTDMAAGVAGGAVATIFDKDILHVNDMVEHIDAKIKSGQKVDANDIMMLRAAQDEEWQKKFNERYKTPFHKMSPQMQQQVMASMPDMFAGADKQAYALNAGLVSTQSLVMEGPQATSNFSAGMQRKAVGGSFVNAETSRRLAAAQQLTSLN